MFLPAVSYVGYTILHCNDHFSLQPLLRAYYTACYHMFSPIDMTKRRTILYANKFAVHALFLDTLYFILYTILKTALCSTFYSMQCHSIRYQNTYTKSRITLQNKTRVRYIYIYLYIRMHVYTHFTTHGTMVSIPCHFMEATAYSLSSRRGCSPYANTIPS